VSSSVSGRRNGILDLVFERLMAKLVQDEPRHGYVKIEQIPLLEDDELAAVLDHIAECSPEDFAKLIDADLLTDWAQALRVTLFTPMVRNAAMGEILKGRLQTSARFWLVEYAATECQVLEDQLPDYDRAELERARAGGDL
jgi:hypothetical protein